MQQRMHNHTDRLAAPDRNQDRLAIVTFIHNWTRSRVRNLGKGEGTLKHQEVGRRMALRKPALSIAYSPDGKLIAANEDLLRNR